MPGLPLVQPEDATPEVARLLDAVQAMTGLTPNLAKAMANSPAVLRAYLEFAGALQRGGLSAADRERIALLVAQHNAADYGLSAHTYVGTKVAGLTEREAVRARRGGDAHPVLAFAAALLMRRGHITDEELRAAREGGLSDTHLAEIVAHVAFNVFSDYFTNAARVAIDWPLVHHTNLERTTIMQARMKNPAQILPGAMEPIFALFKAVKSGGVPETTLELVHLRVSQVNGCSACVDAGAKSARKAGETDERLFAVAAWRETSYFTDAERAALALAESATRLADRPDAVPDEIWEEAAGHYDEPGLASIIMMIAVTNLFNRLNATTRQIAGAW
ncbi:carboxymuconolactone decarboxylase family protein [Nonomuraea sp. NPDC050536]|uniref:carboxymuconolactone decarboxylase family protein n=1 Tax=Nonomuraea sp. NPDC050536 TaxID=3364366 RepID=UPI0037C56E48